MAGDVQFLGELEVFLSGLDWVQVRYARIAAGGAVDLGVITDQRARLHVDLVERFGAGRVNVVAQAPEVEPYELQIDGWSVDRTGKVLTLHFMTGAGGRPYVEVVETAGEIVLRLLAKPRPPGSLPVAARASPEEIDVELAVPVGGRTVRQANGPCPAPYRVDDTDVRDVRDGRLIYRRGYRYGVAPAVPPS